MNQLEFSKISENDRFNRVLEGTAYYASVHTPNMSPTKTTEKKKWKGLPYFGVTLGLDAKNLELAKSYGIKVFEADKFIPMPHVKIQRKIKEGKTSEECKPEVVDSVQRPVPSNILIGNGSTVIVKFATYWYDNDGGGVGSALMKVQIRDLVPFERKGDRAFVTDEGGFKVDDESPKDEDFEDSLPWDDDKKQASN